MPKKFDPDQSSFKKFLPEKEPETLNYKKFKYNKELAELKTDIERITREKPEIKEGYASTYYKLDLKKEFDLLDLRNILYSYLFVRQRNGHIYLNVNDFGIKVKKIIIFFNKYKFFFIKYSIGRLRENKYKSRRNFKII